MIYEHSAAGPVSKIQVTETDRLYDKWIAEPENSGLDKEAFFNFLKTPEAQIFIRKHQSLSIEREGNAVVLTSKFI